MATTVKIHRLTIRGISKDEKNSLKRLAKGKNQSVNGYVLTVIGDLTATDIENFKKNKK